MSAISNGLFTIFSSMIESVELPVKQYYEVQLGTFFALKSGRLAIPEYPGDTGVRCP